MDLIEVSVGGKCREDLGEIVHKLKSSSRNVGCVLLFIGFVREEGLVGGRVRCLHYESYGGLAVEKIKEICKSVVDGENVFATYVHHALGEIGVGEETLIVGVAAKHRAEGLNAVQEIINKVKSEAPIWKKEVTDSGEYWVHEVERGAHSSNQ